jgi:hypothetical protein
MAAVDEQRLCRHAVTHKTAGASAIVERGFRGIHDSIFVEGNSVCGPLLGD